MKREMKKASGNDGGAWAIIHEEFVKYEREAWCFRRHEIDLWTWRNMTDKDTLRMFKARGVTRTYTEFGYMVVGHSRRRWGDNMKVIDRWHVVKAGTEYAAVDGSIDELLK